MKVYWRFTAINKGLEMAAQSCERRAANWSNDGPFATELSIDIHAELMNEAATIRSMKTQPAQSSGHEWPVIHEELVRACIHAALPDSLLPQLRDAELSIMATRIAARINAEIYKQVASVAQPKSSGHEWVSIGEGMYGYCSCDTNYSKQVMTRPMWQAHVASVAQAAQPASAAKPAEDGLEAQIIEAANEVIVHNGTAALTRSSIVKVFSKLIRTHQAARERELREKLEGLLLVTDHILRFNSAVCCEEGCKAGELDAVMPSELLARLNQKDNELRALLASHWPAQKESK